MPTCGYLVITEENAADGVAARLSALAGCEVVRARNRDLLLLVTETDGPEADEALRSRLREVPGIHALLLTFGEITPLRPRGAP